MLTLSEVSLTSSSSDGDQYKVVATAPVSGEEVLTVQLSGETALVRLLDQISNKFPGDSIKVILSSGATVTPYTAATVENLALAISNRQLMPSLESESPDKESPKARFDASYTQWCPLEPICEYQEMINRTTGNAFYVRLNLVPDDQSGRQSLLTDDVLCRPGMINLKKWNGVTPRMLQFLVPPMVSPYSDLVFYKGECKNVLVFDLNNSKTGWLANGWNDECKRLQGTPNSVRTFLAEDHYTDGITGELVVKQPRCRYLKLFNRHFNVNVYVKALYCEVRGLHTGIFYGSDDDDVLILSETKFPNHILSPEYRPGVARLKKWDKVNPKALPFLRPVSKRNSQWQCEWSRCWKRAAECDERMLLKIEETGDWEIGERRYREWEVVNSLEGTPVRMFVDTSDRNFDNSGLARKKPVCEYLEVRNSTMGVSVFVKESIYRRKILESSSTSLFVVHLDHDGVQSMDDILIPAEAEFPTHILGVSPESR